MHPLEEAMLSCDMDGERSDPGYRFIPLGPCLSLVTSLPPFLGPPGIKPLGPGLYLHCAQVSILRSGLWGPAVLGPCCASSLASACCCSLLLT